MNNLKLIVENINQKKLDIALKQCEDYNIKENKYLINNFKGVIYSLKNDQVLAEEYFKKSHNLNEKFEDPLKNLYVINIKKKNYLEAINIAQKLINLNNKNDLFFYQVAYAYELNNDNLLNFHKWYKWKKISQKCKIIVFDRRGYKKKSLNSTTFKRLGKKNLEFINFKKVNISSSQLRKI